MDELEANAAALQSSLLLLLAVPRSIFLRDPLLGPDALLAFLLVDASTLRSIPSLRLPLCEVIELIGSLLGPELRAALLLLPPPGDSSRALPMERVEVAKFPDPALLGTSGLEKVPRLRNSLCSPVLAPAPALLDLTPAQLPIPPVLALFSLRTASRSDVPVLVFA
jgi:hypothetical protein